MADLQALANEVPEVMKQAFCWKRHANELEIPCHSITLQNLEDTLQAKTPLDGNP